MSTVTCLRVLVGSEIEVASASKLLANASNSGRFVRTERLFETRIHRRYLVEITIENKPFGMGIHGDSAAGAGLNFWAQDGSGGGIRFEDKYFGQGYDWVLKDSGGVEMTLTTKNLGAIGDMT